MLQTLFKINYTGQLAQQNCYKDKYSINGVTSNLFQLWLVHHSVFTTAGDVCLLVHSKDS